MREQHKMEWPRSTQLLFLYTSIHGLVGTRSSKPNRVDPIWQCSAIAVQAVPLHVLFVRVCEDARPVDGVEWNVAMLTLGPRGHVIHKLATVLLDIWMVVLAQPWIRMASPSCGLLLQVFLCYDTTHFFSLHHWYQMLPQNHTWPSKRHGTSARSFIATCLSLNYSMFPLWGIDPCNTAAK